MAVEKTVHRALTQLHGAYFTEVLGLLEAEVR